MIYISVSQTQTVFPLRGGHHLAGKENMNVTEFGEASGRRGQRRSS